MNRLGAIHLPRPKGRGAARPRDPLEQLRARLISYFDAPFQAVVTDPSRLIVLAAGRRAGKTTAMLVRWLLTAFLPEVSLLIAPTARKAREVLEPKVEELVRAFPELAGCLVCDPEGVTYLPTGARLQYYGLATDIAAEKLRGGRHPVVLIDELGTYPLRRFELAYDAVSAATFDFFGTPGTGILLAGTASKAYGSVVHWLFEDCPAAAHHGVGRTKPTRYHATLHQNPRFRAYADAVIAEELGRRGERIDGAWAQREIFARFVISAEDSCAPGAVGLSAVPDSLPAEWVGVSAAYRGTTAYVAVAQRNETLYVVSSERGRGHDPATIRDRLQTAWPAAAWACDGAERGLAKLFEGSYGLRLEWGGCAYGPGFASLLSYLDGMLRRGQLVFCTGAELCLKELQALSLDPDRPDAPNPSQESAQVRALLAALSLTTEGAVRVAAVRPSEHSLEARLSRLDRYAGRGR